MPEKGIRAAHHKRVLIIARVANAGECGYHVERLMRDAKITQIYEGTSEVQRIVIGRSVLKEG